MMTEYSNCIETILIAKPNVGCIVQFYWTEKQAPANEYLNVQCQFETPCMWCRQIEYTHSIVIWSDLIEIDLMSSEGTSNQV